MSDYRLYLLDSGRHITSVIELSCGSDIEAMAEVRGRQNTQATELWNSGRRIAAFPADYEPAGGQRHQGD